MTFLVRGKKGRDRRFFLQQGNQKKGGRAPVALKRGKKKEGKEKVRGIEGPNWRKKGRRDPTLFHKGKRRGGAHDVLVAEGGKKCWFSKGGARAETPST